MSAKNTISSLFGASQPASTTTTTTTGSSTSASQQLQSQGLLSSQYYNTTNTIGNGGSSYYPYNTYTIPSPPTLLIKLTLREVTALMQALEKDPDLKALIVKFQPFIGVEI